MRVLVNAFPFFDSQGELDSVTVAFTDITEAKGLEDQDSRARKMENLGILAGAVAQDFDNLLTPILGYFELLRSSPSHLRNEALDAIVDATNWGHDIVSRLVAIGGKQAVELKIIDLRDLVTRFEKAVRCTLPDDVAIRIRIPPTLGSIHGDVRQIEQIQLNLVRLRETPCSLEAC